ncbi:MAG: PQQ-binding-like beta-propeller repeat protein [Planctomycetaceae bacterium]
MTPGKFLRTDARGLFRRLRGVLWCLLLGGLGLACVNRAGLLADELEAPAVAEEESRPRRPGMDRFDMRAAEEPAQIEMLSLVKKSFERRRWDEGVQQLQSLLGEEQDSVVFGEDRQWRPMSEVVLQLIMQSPQEARSAYLTRFGVLADRDLAQARRVRDLTALTQVSRQYFLTPAGQQACRELIDAMIDHGNADRIAKMTKDLMLVESVLLDDLPWRVRLGEVLENSGYKSLAGKLRELPTKQSTPPDDLPVWALSLFGQAPSAVRDWTSLSGSPTGQAIIEARETTLLPRWRQPLVTSPRIRNLLEEISLSFHDQGAMGLSVLATVGSGEVLVTRTLANLTAVNINTGQRLWTSREWGLASTDDPNEIEEIERQIAMNMERDAEGALTYRIRNRLTACGSLGTLSANSRYVFSLASFSSGEMPLETVVQIGFEDDESSEKYLVARELRTGRIAWRAGGPPAEDPTGLPAAGVSFFGPPTPDGDELFVVGERDGDVLLFCMEADTGLVRWEQLLAAAGRRLSEDAVRKSWAAPVAVRGSLAICPTTTGWVTAVDRMARRILWTQRVVNRAADGPDSNEVDLAFDAPNRDVGLDERWPPLQPILLRDRVLFAPIELPEESGATLPKLLSYDLLTGEKLWEIPKNQAIGVVGATEDLVFLFDKLTIQAYRTDTGAHAWTCSQLNAPIAGRPVLTQEGIIVPTLPYSLIRISADQGKVIERSSIGNDDLPLSKLQRVLSPMDSREMQMGSLVSLGGRTVSVSLSDMMALEWESDESVWQANAVSDASARLNWARALVARGQYPEAAQLLRTAVSDVAADNSIAMQTRQMLASILLLQVELLSADTKPDANWKSWLNEAKTLVTTPEDEEALRRQEIKLEIHSGNRDAAWELIRGVIRRPLRFRVDEGQRTVASEAWLADQILTVAQNPDPSLGDALRNVIREEFQSLWKETGANRDAQLRLLRLFAETPFVDSAQLDSLVNTDAAIKLSTLEALTQSRDRDVALKASVQLIEQLATPDWVGEARRRFAELPEEATWPKDVRPTRQELQLLLDQVADVHRQLPPSWQGAHIELVRWADTESYHDWVLPIHWIGEPNESLLNYRYTFNTDRAVLILERQDGSRYCEFPLLTGNREGDIPVPPVLYGSGLNLYLVHTGVVHACSIPGQRILWTRVEDQNSDHDPRRFSNQYQPEPLQSPKALREYSEGYASQFPATSFEVANTRHVVVRTRRGIEVLCSLTGQLLWELSDCPSENVRCDEDRLYRLGSNRVRAFSIRSGRSQQIPGRSEFSSMLFALDTAGITTLSEHPGQDESWLLERHRVRALPIAGRPETARDRWDESDQLQFEAAWSLPIEMSSRLGDGPPGQGLWLDALGELKLVPWKTGVPRSLGKVDLNVPKEADAESGHHVVYGLWDRSRVYLIHDSAPGQSFVDSPAVSVHGDIVAINRESPEQRWKYPFQGFLLSSSLDLCPILPLIRVEELEVAGYSVQKVHLALVDKQSGQVVYDLHTQSFGIGVSSCEYHPSEQRLDVMLQREQLRIRRRIGVSP